MFVPLFSLTLRRFNTFVQNMREPLRPKSAQLLRRPLDKAKTRYKMVEDFSLRKEGGLDLPHKYKIELEISGQGGSFRADWEMNLSQFAFNQKIDPAIFRIDNK